MAADSGPQATIRYGEAARADGGIQYAGPQNDSGGPSKSASASATGGSVSAAGGVVAQNRSTAGRSVRTQ